VIDSLHFVEEKEGL